MNDLAILSIPLAGAIFFYLVWLYQLRQHEAALRAAKRARIEYAREQNALVRAQIKAQEGTQAA